MRTAIFHLFLVAFPLNLGAITSLKEIKDMADELVAATYTAEALVELLEEVEGSEESRRDEYASMLNTANMIRDELDELQYASNEIDEILGPVFNTDSLERNIKNITARIKKIKSFRNRAMNLLRHSGKASNDAMLSNETNKILREIQSEQMRARIDADKSKLHLIKVESAKKVKKKNTIRSLWKAIELDSKSRMLPSASPILVEKSKEVKRDGYW